MASPAPDLAEDPDPGAPVPRWVMDTALVPAELAGQRLDAVAARLFPDYSRARLKSWIEVGSLRVDGAAASRGRQPVAAGSTLTLDAEAPPIEGTITAQNLPIEVVFADASIAIIHKPAGLTVHPGAGQSDGTLQNALLHHFPQTASVPRAGIVHRLDKDTSGLLVVALDVSAHAKLVDALERRAIRREYDAIVSGTVVAGTTIDLPIDRHPRDRLKMAVVEGGRPAVTHYRVQERFTHHTHLRVKLETGRTHQIRVHLSHRRLPIVGDALYGGRIARGKGLSEDLRRLLLEFPRQALHARELELDHPATGERLAFSAEMPEDLLALAAALRRERGA